MLSKNTIAQSDICSEVQTIMSPPAVVPLSKVLTPVSTNGFPSVTDPATGVNTSLLSHRHCRHTLKISYIVTIKSGLTSGGYIKLLPSALHCETEYKQPATAANAKQYK